MRALRCALGLELWDPSPLPSEITAGGVSEDNPPPPKSTRLHDKSYEKVLTLQRELLAVAGWPDCREAYERNLRNAEEERDDCARLVRDPDARHQGTGMDAASLRRALRDAREKWPTAKSCWPNSKRRNNANGLKAGLPSHEIAYFPQLVDMRGQRCCQQHELRFRADERLAVWCCRALQAVG